MSYLDKLNVHVRFPPDDWFAFRDQVYRHGLRVGDTVIDIVREWTEARRREAVPHYLRKGDRDATK